MEIGNTLPNLTLPATGDKMISLPDLVGHNVVFYFYPKDDTPGCTQEGQDFRDHYEAFKATDTLIFGISRDSVKAHEKFQAKYNFPFDLLSDQDQQLCQLFDVLKFKNMFGKQVKVVERSTFLFDYNGKLRQIWRNIKVSKHVEQVLETIKGL
ncbi:AhpC/TSA family protein [Beggiatoa sp. PS]|nr:AhpC/TSA family protein [Beggiatoa sp. PS]